MDADEDEADDIATSDPSAKLQMGDFSCPLLMRHIFPLHWRLKPAQTLASLSANVLHPLSVTNRKRTFVYASGNTVVYMKLSESSGDDNPAASPSSSSGNVGSPLVSARSTPSVEDLANSTMDSPISGSAARRLPVRSIESGSISLEVFGVELPSKEVMEEFVAMIENKINALTLNILSTLLSRNIALKLSAQDVDFIMPPSSKPKTEHFIAIPNSVHDPYLFLTLLKQNVLLYLNAASSPDLIANLNHYLSFSLKISEDSFNQR